MGECCMWFRDLGSQSTWNRYLGYTNMTKVRADEVYTNWTAYDFPSYEYCIRPVGVNPNLK